MSMQAHGSWRALCLTLTILALFCQPAVGKDKKPQDVAGYYDSAQMKRCKCWNPNHCDCVHDQCEFIERYTLGSPDKDGYFDITIGAQDKKCLNSTMGPFQLHVDHVGRVMGGVLFEGSWPHPVMTPFNPLKLEQDLSMVIVGDIFGFDENPAGYRSIVIDRHNITVCDTDEFLKNKCTPGQPRYMCRDQFSSCAGGKCLEENLDSLSPKDDAFFSQFSATGLNGTYTLSLHESSPDCPKELSVWQFGSQLGIGESRADMHMARVSDTSMAWKEAGVVQFQTQCSGLQWHMDMALAGEFEEVDNEMQLTVFLMLPWHDEGVIEVEKCVMRATIAPKMFANGCSHTTVVVLAVLLFLALFLAGGLAALFLLFRRKYIETKITRQYEIFQG